MYEVEVTLPKRRTYETPAVVTAEFTAFRDRKAQVRASERGLEILGWSNSMNQFTQYEGSGICAPFELVRDVIAAYEKAAATPPILE